MPGVDVGVCYRAATEAAEVGGDFYDVVQLARTGSWSSSATCAARASRRRPVAGRRVHAARLRPGRAAGQALSRLNATVLIQLPGSRSSRWSWPTSTWPVT